MFATTTPPGASRSRSELDELARREVERDRVREVRVERDHVVALLVPLQVAAPVLHRDLQPRMVGHREVPPRHVDDDRVELRDLEVERREVPPEALRRGGAAEADDEDVARVRVVGEAEVEVVGVAEARLEGPADRHPALERVVEAEVARAAAVVDHREVVVARVLLEDDVEAAGGVVDVAAALVPRAVERRPVLGRDALEALALLRRDAGRGDRGGGRERHRHDGDNREPLGERDEDDGREEHRRGRGEQLADAELRDEPEGGHERAGDAAGGRDRVQASRRYARPCRRSGRRGGSRSARPTRARRSRGRRG